MASKSCCIGDQRQKSIRRTMRSPQVTSTPWLDQVDILSRRASRRNRLLEHVQLTCFSTCSMNFQFAAFAEAYVESYIIGEIEFYPNCIQASPVIPEEINGMCFKPAHQSAVAVHSCVANTHSLILKRLVWGNASAMSYISVISTRVPTYQVSNFF